MTGADRTALWVSTDQRTKGGVATYVRTLLASPLQERWQIRHIATHTDGSVLARIGTFAAGAARVVFVIVRDRPHIVHLHTASYGSFVRKATLFWIARAAGCRVVLHVHGGEFHLFHDRAPRGLQRVIRATLGRADAVIALGVRWADRLADIQPAACITVVPNATDSRPVSPQPAPAEAVHVVFLGMLAESKGVYSLLEAWSRLTSRPEARPAKLTLAGHGEVERVRTEIVKLGLGHTVDLREWLSPDDVRELLSSGHVLVLPSLNEGQPMSVLEAMASGLCVVATSVGGIPELVEDETSGLLIPPSDVGALVVALGRVLDDDALRTRLGAAGHARARAEFDVEVVWRRLDIVYRTVLGDRVDTVAADSGAQPTEGAR